MTDSGEPSVRHFAMEQDAREFVSLCRAVYGENTTGLYACRVHMKVSEREAGLGWFIEDLSVPTTAPPYNHFFARANLQSSLTSWLEHLFDLPDDAFKVPGMEFQDVHILDTGSQTQGVAL